MKFLLNQLFWMCQQVSETGHWVQPLLCPWARGAGQQLRRRRDGVSPLPVTLVSALPGSKWELTLGTRKACLTDPKTLSDLTGILITFWYLVPDNWFELYRLEIVDSSIYGSMRLCIKWNALSNVFSFSTSFEPEVLLCLRQQTL